MGIIVEIDEKQAEKLRALTHQEDLAAAVERAVRMLDGKTLGQLEAEDAEEPPSADEEEARQKAWDILMGMAGICQGGPSDLADRHDHYLYDVGEP
jgi:hypothetical protein